jgi:3-hydroxybutyryl-CoA dehydrogenase
MGARIAYRCAISGFETRLFDTYPDALRKAVDKIETWMQAGVQDGHISVAQASQAKGKIKAFSSLEKCLKQTDLVIETVPENLTIKRRVLSEIDRHLSAKAFVCTNSSSLPCSRMADVLSRPERFFNINFSQPQDPSDKLVELMRGAKTGDEALIAGESFVRALNMVPIITYREIMGFSFNRVWRAIKRETLHLVADGYSDFQDLDRAWIMEFGSPWGPFGLMDIIGLDVIRDIEQQYYLDSGEERDRPPAFLEKMVRDGNLGVKSGQGFYAYPDPAYKDPAWLHKQGAFSEDIAEKLSQMKTMGPGKHRTSKKAASVKPRPASDS